MINYKKYKNVMKILIVGILFLKTSFTKAQIYSDSISVNFFLIDECRISQDITNEINYVANHFVQKQFNFNGYFPRTTSTEEKIENFIKEYDLKILCFTDYDKLKTKFYGATIAPEVVVYDEKNQTLIYRGRINNSFADLGRRRRVVSSFDLRIVLEDILKQQKTNVIANQAIGCYIN